MSESLLLVRLHKQQPDGTVVGESKRTCHLVPIPNPAPVPDFLVAHCGLRITPGVGEVLSAVTGMPCETCLARSSLPLFGMLSRIGHHSRGDLSSAASASAATPDLFSPSMAREGSQPDTRPDVPRMMIIDSTGDLHPTNPGAEPGSASTRMRNPSSGLRFGDLLRP